MSELTALLIILTVGLPCAGLLAASRYHRRVMRNDRRGRRGA